MDILPTGEPPIFLSPLDMANRRYQEDLILPKLHLPLQPTVDLGNQKDMDNNLEVMDNNPEDMGNNPEDMDNNPEDMDNPEDKEHQQDMEDTVVIQKDMDTLEPEPELWELEQR